MKTEALNPVELRAAGYKALSKALGAAGMARFLSQLDRGRGDYTRDRHAWNQGQSVESIAARVRTRKKKTK